MNATPQSIATRPGAAISDAQFKTLSEIAFSEAGLMISDSKRQMIQSRITRHLRDIRCDDLEHYLREIQSDKDGNLTRDLISVLTTNVSSFFRERHHFDMLRDDVLPGLVKRARSGHKIRIWSAGCSSGQEPYSIAMLLLNCLPDIQNLDFKILGTDIDRKILDRAHRASYSPDEMVSLPSDMSRKYLISTQDPKAPYEISGVVRNMVTLRPLNLLRPWPMKSTFDAIFCRNVLIYFDAETQNDLWPRFHAALGERGTLFLGHSERIQSPEKVGFSPCGVTTYTKQNLGKVRPEP